MQLQPARWDKSKLPASDDDDGPSPARSRPSSASLSPERSDPASATRSLSPLMHLRERKSTFEFRVIKQASATPSQSSSAASTDKELVPIPSPPWAKSKPLPPENQPMEGPEEGLIFSSSHYFPNASTNRYYRTQPSSSSLPPFRSLDTRSPPPERKFPSTSHRSSPPLPPRHQYQPSHSETGAPSAPSSPKPYHPYYRSQSFDYPPPPPQPMRHRSYHHLPSLSSPSPNTGQKRRYASDDEGDPHAVRGRRIDLDTNGRESGLDVDKRLKEDMEREKASRTLPPLPPFRPRQQGGHRLLSYPGHSPPSSAPPPLGASRNEHYYTNDNRGTGNPPSAPPGYPEYTPPARYPPPASGSHAYHPPSTYRNGPPPSNHPPSYRPPPPEHLSYPQSYASYPSPPRAYGSPPPPPPPPPRPQAPPLLQAPPPKQPPQFSPNRHATSARAKLPPSPPPPPHSQLLPSSTPHSYFHKIRLNRPKQSRLSTRRQSQTQTQEHQQGQDDQTPSQQAAAARHAAYSSPDTVDSMMLTTHPVPYSIGVKAASSTAGMPGDAGRLVGEYEQHPLRQQTSYLPISAVGGAQFVLKPPRIPKTKSSKLRFMVSGPAATSVLPLASVSQFSEVVQTNGADNFVAGGITSVVEPRPFLPNPEDVLIEIKQEEESVTASVAAITIAEPHEPSGDGAVDEEDATSAVDARGIAKEFDDNDVGGSTAVLSLGSPTDFMNSETNTFAAPARPSRKVKKYPCDICGHIFTRSGDVNRHKESRHRESAGCICPYCGRSLTRQDALQRHWDKYCRKKSKRMDRRRRFGLSFDPGIDVDPVFLHPAPGHSNVEEGNQASLGGSSGIDVRSFRTIRSADRSKTLTFRRKNGKQNARSHMDGDGDVRMFSGSESESEVDELESEDPLDGYDSERGRGRGRGRRDKRGLEGHGDDENEEIDELNESDDNERADGVKSDAEGESINGDDFYTISGESEEDESEDEDGMDVRPDARPIMDGVTMSPPEVLEEGLAPESFPHTAFTRPPILESPSQVTASDRQMLPQRPVAKGNAVNSPHLSNFKQVPPPLSFVEFRRPPPSPPVKKVPSNPRSAPAPAPRNAQSGAPMSAFTNTFPVQPPLRQPKARTEYRFRYNTSMVPPQQQTAPPPRHAPVVHGPPSDSSLSVQVHIPPASLGQSDTSATARIRRGPKPRRNDFDAVLDPSQTAAQGGQIRMRVLPQATHTPPVQPALAIMHEQPHVAKRKGKRMDGLVPEDGFVPREYVYRGRE